MNRAAKGTRQEYKSRRILEAAGYSVTRAAASLGVWDLIAIGAADIVLLQVKCASHPPRPEELEAMRLFRAPKNARKLIHLWRDYARMPEVREL